MLGDTASEVVESAGNTTVKTEAGHRYRTAGRKRRGLDDLEHRTRQAHLYDVLDQHWCDYGLSLQALTNWMDVPDAFRGVHAASDAPVLKLLKVRLTEDDIASVRALLGDCDTRGFADQLQNMREERPRLGRKLNAINSEIFKLGHILSDIDSELRTTMAPSLRNEFLERRKTVSDKLTGRGKDRDHLEVKTLRNDLLEKCEAYFAQTQVFEFCHKRSHELTPLNVANALASIPFVSCKSSSRTSVRLLLHKQRARFNYEVFLLIDKLLRFCYRGVERIPSPEDISADVDTFLDKLSESPAATDLKQHKRFLVRAVQTVSRRTAVASTSRTFLVMRKYRRPSSAESRLEAIDRLMGAASEL